MDPPPPPINWSPAEGYVPNYNSPNLFIPQGSNHSPNPYPVPAPHNITNSILQLVLPNDSQQSLPPPLTTYNNYEGSIGYNPSNNLPESSNPRINALGYPQIDQYGHNCILNLDTYQAFPPNNPQINYFDQPVPNLLPDYNPDQTYPHNYESNEVNAGYLAGNPNFGVAGGFEPGNVAHEQYFNEHGQNYTSELVPGSADYNYEDERRGLGEYDNLMLNQYFLFSPYSENSGLGENVHESYEGAVDSEALESSENNKSQPEKKNNSNISFNSKEEVKKNQKNQIINEKPSNSERNKNYCWKCKYNGSDLIKHKNDFICTICISNHFEEFLCSKSKDQIKCGKCNEKMEANLFKDHVLHESYKEYLERPCARRTSSTKKRSDYFNSSQKDKCEFCGEKHDDKTTCLNHYLNRKMDNCPVCKTKHLNQSECDDKLCERCLKESIIKQLQKDPFAELVCEKCSHRYSNPFLYELYKGKENFDNMKIIQAQSLFDPTRDCNICFLNFRICDMITLYCDHRFCKSCIKAYFTSCINSSEFSQIRKCPQCLSSPEKGEESKSGVKSPDKMRESFISRNQFKRDSKCETEAIPEAENEISTYTILDNLDEREKELFYKLGLKSLKNDSENKNMFMKWCKNCEFGMFIDGDDQYFDCPNCKTHYCAKCHTEHMEGFCPDFRKTVTKQTLRQYMNDYYIEELMKDISKCPGCGEGVYKMNGCNFLKCEWPQCTGVYFCSICKKQLTLEQHYSHFKKSGPFGLTCNTTDRIAEA